MKKNESLEKKINPISEIEFKEAMVKISFENLIRSYLIDMMDIWKKKYRLQHYLIGSPLDIIRLSIPSIYIIDNKDRNKKQGYVNEHCDNRKGNSLNTITGAYRTQFGIKENTNCVEILIFHKFRCTDYIIVPIHIYYDSMPTAIKQFIIKIGDLIDKKLIRSN